MSAGNPSNGGIVAQVVADFSEFDRQMAAKRSQGYTIPVKVTGDGSTTPAAAAVAQAQGASIAAGTPGINPATPGVPSLANVGASPQSGAFSPQLATALQSAAQAMSGAAQQLSQAALQQTQAARAMVSAVQAGAAGATTGPGAAARSVAAGAGAGASPQVRGLSIPQSGNAFASRLSFGIGGIGGVVAGFGLETIRQIASERQAYDSGLNELLASGGTPTDQSRFALADVERRRSNFTTALQIGNGRAVQYQRGSLRDDLNQEERFAAGALDTARGNEFESGQVRFRRSQDLAERLALDPDPFSRELTRIRFASKERQQSILESYARQRATIQDVPGNKELNEDRENQRKALDKERDNTLNAELGTPQEKDVLGFPIESSRVGGRLPAELSAAQRDFGNRQSVRAAVLDSTSRSILTRAGLTPASYGQNRGTRSALSEIEDIAGSTENARYEAILSGNQSLIPNIAALGRNRLLALRSELTSSSEGVEVDPRRQALTGVGTFNAEAVQRGIAAALGRAGSTSAALPPQIGQESSGPAVATNTANMDAKLGMIQTALSELLSKIQVA